MNKTERFGLALSTAEKEALLRLAEREHISASAVIRRLIWRAVESWGADSGEVRPDATPPDITKREESPQ
jgi:hypothetical protein